MEFVAKVEDFGNNPIEPHPQLARPLGIQQLDHELMLGEQGANETKRYRNHDCQCRAFGQHTDEDDHAKQYRENEYHDGNGQQEMTIPNVGFVGDDEPDAGDHVNSV